VQPYRARRDGPALHQLKTRLHGWIRDQLDQLEQAVPDLPVEDRAADTWEPLIAVADLAGGNWPTRARTAALALTRADVDVENVSLKVRLLIDCRTAFRDADGLPTETLIGRLRDDPEAPWDTLGKLGLRPRSLGSMLHEFAISSATHRWPDGAQTKGYRRDQFTDAWNRYCPHPGPGHLSVPSVPPSHTPESGTDSPTWDGSSVPNPPKRPKFTLMGRRDGWDGYPASTETAVCITCRQPLSYDDGTHTHPTCSA